MKNRYKVGLGLLIGLISLTVIVNLPMISIGITETDCSISGCNTHVVYESISQVYFPCTFSTCIGTGNVRTVMLEYATLSSGTASTSQGRGTANLTARFNNPGSTTTISSVTFAGNGSSTTPMTVYQCPSAVSCDAVSSPSIAANSVTEFNTTSTAFYFSTNITSGATYNYVFNFANGQSVSGSLKAG